MEAVSENKKIYQENYLLKTGIFGFLFFSALSIVLDHFGVGDQSSRSIRFNDIQIFQLIIGGVFVAPVFEELSFRGVYTGKKYLKFISYAGIAYFILAQESYFLIPLLILFIILIELKKRKNYLTISYFVNALLFSLMHYQFKDILNISSIPGILGTVGLALVLIWLVRNFGLWASILLHFLTNASLIGVAVAGYENLDKQIKTVENNSFTMTFQRVSLFEQEQSLMIQSDEISAKNTSISEINRTLCPNSELKEVYFGKYNIIIKNKTGVQNKLNCSDFLDLLHKSKINEE